LLYTNPPPELNLFVGGDEAYLGWLKDVALKMGTPEGDCLDDSVALSPLPKGEFDATELDGKRLLPNSVPLSYISESR